ncbi:hypothetical protein F5050DRAFT_1582323 [Lentinula boryana]|uniref:Uncharacterized protein n=1 Tax=Lentinula boryana TaxID=40481 RepID=A0ABQ8PWT5_9AGAR|nr:hypothetical protein F5050DRAFT_1582323 [Lentinula boryana]
MISLLQRLCTRSWKLTLLQIFSKDSILTFHCAQSRICSERLAFVALLLPRSHNWHIEARLPFSAWHLAWEDLATFLEAHVFFSDESKFIIHGSDGRRYCCHCRGQDRFVKQNVIGTMKHSVGHGKDKGKLKVWGCITPWGVRHIARVKGILNSQQLTKIWQNMLITMLQDHGIPAYPIICMSSSSYLPSSPAGSSAGVILSSKSMSLLGITLPDNV